MQIKLIILLSALSLFSCKKEDLKVSVKPNSKEPKAMASKIQNKISLEQLECKTSFEENNTYKLDCNNFSAYNNVFTASDNNKYELITLKLKDIDKAIIRKINEEDLPTSGLYVYSNPSDKSFVLFFPLIGEQNFGWKIYYYKNNILYPLGQRITYWKPEFEESDISYKNFMKIYQSNNVLTIEIPNKYIVGYDEDYNNYPNYMDGKFYERNNYYYEFSLSAPEYYKKYKNGLFEGDYNKMINNNIINFIQ